MPVCRSCSGEVEASFRFCPWCASPVRHKLMEFFPARPFPGEIGKALRVSRYFPDGVEPGHVRFSVWNETGVAEAVVSLDDSDASRLAEFIRDNALSACEPCDEPGVVTERL
jgi:hypothetical protein